MFCLVVTARRESVGLGYMARFVCEKTTLNPAKIILVEYHGKRSYSICIKLCR
jgi:hypothetical protein